MREEGNYGVPKGIYTRMKIGLFFARDLLVVGGFFGVYFLMSPLFPKSQGVQQLLFMGVNLLMGIFLILPANGTQRNFNVLWLLLKRLIFRKTLYYTSINRYEVGSMYDERRR